MSSAVRSTALRAGGACVRCRKGKTKCVYESGRAPCKNCAKGMHECYLPSESMSHGGHGVSPARVQHRVRDSLPSERIVSGVAGGQGPPASAVARHVSSTNDKYVPFLSSPARSFAAALLSFLFGVVHIALHSLFPLRPPIFLTGRAAAGGAGRLLCAISGRCALPPLRAPPRCCPPASGCSPPRLTTPLDAPKMALQALPLGAPPQAPSPISFSARPPFSNPSPLNLACSVRILPSQSRVAWRPAPHQTEDNQVLAPSPPLHHPKSQTSVAASVGVSVHRPVLPRLSSLGLRRSGSFWGALEGRRGPPRWRRRRCRPRGRQCTDACIHAAHCIPFGNHRRGEACGCANASHSGRPS